MYFLLVAYCLRAAYLRSIKGFWNKLAAVGVFWIMTFLLEVRFLAIHPPWTVGLGVPGKFDLLNLARLWEQVGINPCGPVLWNQVAGVLLVAFFGYSLIVSSKHARLMSGLLVVPYLFRT